MIEATTAVPRMYTFNGLGHSSPHAKDDSQGGFGASVAVALA
jgi:hypothetical protein